MGAAPNPDTAGSNTREPAASVFSAPKFTSPTLPASRQEWEGGLGSKIQQGERSRVRNPASRATWQHTSAWARVTYIQRTQSGLVTYSQKVRGNGPPALWSSQLVNFMITVSASPPPPPRPFTDDLILYRQLQFVISTDRNRLQSLTELNGLPSQEPPCFFSGYVFLLL